MTNSDDSNNDDDSGYDDGYVGRSLWAHETTQPEQLTLALLEDLATVLAAHGYPPLRGYALAELTSSLCRIGQLRP